MLLRTAPARKGADVRPLHGHRYPYGHRYWHRDSVSVSGFGIESDSDTDSDTDSRTEQAGGFVPLQTRAMMLP